MSRMLEKYIDFVLAYRLWVIIGVVIASVAASSGITKLTFASDYRIFFGADNPDLKRWDDFQATFSKNDNIFFVLQFPEGEAFDQKMALVVEDLTERAWTLPNATRVDSISNYQRTRATDDFLEVEDLIVGASELSQAELQERSAFAVSEPALYRAILSEDLRTTGVNVSIELQGDQDAEGRRTAVAAHDMADDIRATYPELKVAMNGSMIMNYGFVQSGERDMMTLIPGMYLLMLALTWVMLRSFSGMVATLITIILSTTVALGIAGFLGMRMAPITIIAPNIILTLAVADCIHIISSMQRHLRAGMEKTAAIKEALRKNFTAVFITSVTTAVGFLSLNYSDAPPFQYLGNITAFGVLAAWILAITFVPAFLSYMPLKSETEIKAGYLERFMAGFANTAIRHARAILVVGGLGSATLVGLALTNNLDDRFSRYFGESLQVRQDLDFVSANLRGQDIFEYEIRSGEPNGINDPHYLTTLDNFVTWLREQPEVDQVTAFSDVIKRLNQNMNGDNAAFYSIPENPQLSAQYLLLYELSLPFGLDLNNQINIDKSSTRLSVIIKDIHVVAQNEFHDRVSGWISENAPDGMIEQPTGISKIFGSLTLRNITEMITGNIIAVVVISLLMMMTLRSIGIGAISVVTNVVPAMITFGLWAIFVGQIGLAAAVIGAASLGIVVDDSVHFLTKYLRGRREKNLNKEDAIRYAFAEVGEAIVFTSIIVGAGFAMIAFSTFQVNAQLGLLTAITVIVAMFFDFLVLPAILLLGGDRTKSTIIQGDSDVETAPAE
ncbi:MAG: efflux RND transporter permease subunit [Paracoccaceae bacterium]